MIDTYALDLPRVGPPRPARQGQTLLWYDSPVVFEVETETIPGYILANLIPDEAGWIDSAVAIALQGEALTLAQARRADMRMLMTRPDASLWRVDKGNNNDLVLRSILDPLPDRMLPDTGLFINDFGASDTQG